MTYEYQRIFNKNGKYIQIKNNQRYFPNIYIGTYEDLKNYEKNEYNFGEPGGIYVGYRFGTPESIHDKRLQPHFIKQNKKPSWVTSLDGFFS